MGFCYLSCSKSHSLIMHAQLSDEARDFPFESSRFYCFIEITFYLSILASTRGGGTEEGGGGIL